MRRQRFHSDHDPNDKASKMNFRRSIHSDSDYVWQYCSDGAPSAVSTDGAASTVFSDDETFVSAPTSRTGDIFILFDTLFSLILYLVLHSYYILYM